MYFFYVDEAGSPEGHHEPLLDGETPIFSLDEFNGMVISQKGLCALCGKEMLNTRTAVDHDHKSGKIRGILHSTCNVLLGYAREDIGILSSAIDYLNYHNGG